MLVSQCLSSSTSSCSTSITMDTSSSSSLLPTSSAIQALTSSFSSMVWSIVLEVLQLQRFEAD